MQGKARVAVAGATGRVGRHVVDVLTGTGARGGRDLARERRRRRHRGGPGRGAGRRAGDHRRCDGRLPGAGGARSSSPSRPGTCRRRVGEPECERLVVVSIIGIDRFTGGYAAAKVAHEQATLAGPIPAAILRAAQFHEFVAQLIDWGRQGEVSYVPGMRTQLVAARRVARRSQILASRPRTSTRWTRSRRSRAEGRGSRRDRDVLAAGAATRCGSKA